METKELRRLFQQLVDGTISAEGLNRFFAYVKVAKGRPEFHHLMAELWGYVELSNAAESEGPDEAGFIRLQKNIRQLNHLVDEETPPEVIEEVIEKIVKGYYE